MGISQETLKEAYLVVERLAKSRSANGAFAYYETSDVYQEIWCMCLEAMDRYDATIGPIENYLVRHITNRLKNLKRDKYFRPGSDISSSGLAFTRMNLVNALPLDGGNIAEQGVLLCSSTISADPVEYMLRDETLLYIRERMPSHLREPFEEMLGYNRVRSPLAQEVQQQVTEILSQRGDHV